MDKLRNRYSSHTTSRRSFDKNQDRRRSRSKSRSSQSSRNRRSRSRDRKQYRSQEQSKFTKDKYDKGKSSRVTGISADEIRQIAMNVYEEVAKETKDNIASIIKTANIYETPKQPNESNQPKYKVNYTENTAADEVGGYVHQIGQMFPVSKGEVHKISEEKTVIPDEDDCSSKSDVDSVFAVPDSTTPDQDLKRNDANFENGLNYNDELEIARRSWEAELGKTKPRLFVPPSLWDPQMWTAPCSYPINTSNAASPKVDKWLVETEVRHIEQTEQALMPPPPPPPPDEINSAYTCLSAYGARLMKKMGWHEGEGLGKCRHGTTSALIFETKHDRRGLASYQEKYEAILARKNKLAMLKSNLLNTPQCSNPNKNPISALNEYCQKNKMPPPIFQDAALSDGVFPLFRVSVTVMGQIFLTPNGFSSKKEAKNKTAQLALDQLGII